MSPLSRALVLFVACGFASSSAAADDSEETLGGFICVRPFSPPCAAQAETFQSAEKIAACRSEIERFVAATTVYRDCLEGKIAAAVRAANDAVDYFHCMTRGEACTTNAKRH